jgi:adenosylcobinamide-GDP ribazoletransferase
MILLLILSTDYASKDGMAMNMIKHLPRQSAYIIVGVCIVIGFTISLWGMVFALVGFFLLRRLMLKHLGGCTGDTIGATVEITEVLFLVGYIF